MIDELWQVDPSHPGVWLASTRIAARWYAGENGSVVTAELGTRDVLDLRDPNIFKDLLTRTAFRCRMAQVRKAHANGNLYLLDDGAIQNALVAEAFRSHAGVVLRDRTDTHSHLSLVLQRPDALTVLSERPVRPALQNQDEKLRARGA